MEIPKFKLQTVSPIEKSKVEKFFNPLIELNEKQNSEIYLTKDGFFLKYIKTELENFLIVEIHCVIKPLEKSAGYSLHGLRYFLTFCQETDTEILIIENGNKIQCSEGALMSEFYSFYRLGKHRRVKHYIENPKDRERMKKTNTNTMDN
ncbi:hypothetical protein [Kordia jejudonensis]|uniref:hypothetical protein n=1 Tax=Kordia jejudonensis TaxID=1348245 RepID=UPI0006299846|nr:hypothetical protein [Kordia jejudonensis]